MPIPYPYHDYVGRDLAKQIGLTGNLLNKFADLANKLYRLFESKDLELAEINPLIITDGDEVLALDGKITICDDASSRHKCFAGWTETHMLDLSDREKRSKRAGLNLVELEGNIGILCSGAGLTMATMDLVKAFGGEPGNFLDAGGGSDTEKTLEALEIVHDNPKCSVILVNILGGITACDEVAQALVAFMKRHLRAQIDRAACAATIKTSQKKMLAESGPSFTRTRVRGERSGRTIESSSRRRALNKGDSQSDSD